MPVQRFAPMTKDFATFDCDAHVTEPPLIWERAKDFLTRDELDALKRTIWWDADGRLLIVNGRAGIGLGSPQRGGIPGTMRVISNAGPGVKHDIQRALNVRNLNPKTVGHANVGTRSGPFTSPAHTSMRSMMRSAMTMSG
jgi:hypothetical protein